MLRMAGAQVWRVGFNAGDRVFWPHRDSYIAFQDSQDQWADTLDRLLSEKRITDIVLYGDTRPLHAEAVRQGKARGLRVHVLEEGYLRPYWMTYERGGANGHSRLLDLGIDDMRRALRSKGAEVSFPTASHWGDMREHVFYGALYHWFVMFTNRAYRKVQRHQELPVQKELMLYLGRLFLCPTTRWNGLSKPVGCVAGGIPIIWRFSSSSMMKAFGGTRISKQWVSFWT